MNYRNLNYEDPNDIRKAILKISCCTSSSGGGTPGGSDSQIQYNNGGVFGGTTGFTFNDSDNRVHLSNAPSPTPSYALFNLGPGPFDGGSSGYFVGNGNGTILGINGASGYIGDLINLQVAGSPRLKINASVGETTFYIGSNAKNFRLRNTADNTNYLSVEYNSTYGTFLQGSDGGTERLNVVLTTTSTESRSFRVLNSSYTPYFTVAGTGNVGINIATSLTARLQVRGNGSDPVARFEDSVGSKGFIFNSTGSIEPIHSDSSITAGFDGGFRLSGSVLSIVRNVHSTFSSLNRYFSGYDSGHIFASPSLTSPTSGTSITHGVERTIALTGAGSANHYINYLGYTINNSAAQSGTATGIYLNATETALNSMSHDLLNLLVGGSSKFRVSNAGALALSSNVTTVGAFYSYGTNEFYGNTRNSGSLTAGYGGSPSARLHVRGDGVNSIVRFENNSGTPYFRINSSNQVLLENLPTSSAGLPSGGVWNDSGTLKIV